MPEWTAAGQIEMLQQVMEAELVRQEDLNQFFKMVYGMTYDEMYGIDKESKWKKECDKLFKTMYSDVQD